MAISATIQNTPFHVGDTIQVHYKLIEKEKVTGKAKREVKEETRERIQIFEGIVLGIRGDGENASFTVRRIATGNIGVERVFPVVSPWIKGITVKRPAIVRRAKLYYLRDKVGKAAVKLKERKLTAEEVTAQKAAKSPAKKIAAKKEEKPVEETQAVEPKA